MGTHCGKELAPIRSVENLPSLLGADEGGVMRGIGRKPLLQYALLVAREPL